MRTIISVSSVDPESTQELKIIVPRPIAPTSQLRCYLKLADKDDLANIHGGLQIDPRELLAVADMIRAILNKEKQATFYECFECGKNVTLSAKTSDNGLTYCRECRPKTA